MTQVRRWRRAEAWTPEPRHVRDIRWTVQLLLRDTQTQANSVRLCICRLRAEVSSPNSRPGAPGDVTGSPASARAACSPEPSASGGVRVPRSCRWTSSRHQEGVCLTSWSAGRRRLAPRHYLLVCQDGLRDCLDFPCRSAPCCACGVAPRSRLRNHRVRHPRPVFQSATKFGCRRHRWGHHELFLPRGSACYRRTVSHIHLGRRLPAGTDTGVARDEGHGPGHVEQRPIGTGDMRPASWWLSTFRRCPL